MNGWTKSLFDNPSDENLNEWLEIAKLSAGPAGCDAGLFEARRIWEKSVCFIWEKGDEKFMVLFTNKTHTEMKSWKLQTYHDPKIEDKIVPLVVQTVKDFGKPIYVIKNNMPRHNLMVKVLKYIPEIKVI